MSWVLVDSDTQLQEALLALRGARDLAVDTEFMRRSTYYPQVALLQLCAGETAWLIDPLAITDTQGIVDLMVDPQINKILHSCSEDLEVFRHWLGVVPDPLIDTQRVLALTGDDHGMGYRSMVQALLGVELDKGETRSDWLKRPLSESQCHYAALDVLYLLQAWQILEQRVQQRERMSWVLEEGAECARVLLERELEAHRKIKASHRLSRRQKAVLEHISAWRENRARSVDKPRKWVLDDQACVAIAQAMPCTTGALAAIDGVPPSVVRKQGEVLVEVVRTAQALAEEDLPAQSRTLSAEQRQRLKAMRAFVRTRAGELGIAPELLCSGGDLELLLRQIDGEQIREPERWHGWRNAQIITPLREAGTQL